MIEKAKQLDKALMDAILDFMESNVADGMIDECDMTTVSGVVGLLYSRLIGTQAYLTNKTKDDVQKTMASSFLILIEAALYEYDAASIRDVDNLFPQTKRKNDE